MERDPCMYGDFQNFRNFNSHAHVERDYTTGAGTAIVFNFNSHAHVERDRVAERLITLRLLFQLTRSRGA